jgi:hypothetical protein
MKRVQLLWCHRCSTAFVFTGARFEHAVGGKPAIRHEDCGALNEIAPNGMSEDGFELWKVVGEVEPMHSRASAGISRPPP